MKIIIQFIKDFLSKIDFSEILRQIAILGSILNNDEDDEYESDDEDESDDE